jgi:hypothetical protein
VALEHGSGEILRGVYPEQGEWLKIATTAAPSPGIGDWNKGLSSEGSVADSLASTQARTLFERNASSKQPVKCGFP